MTKSIMDEGCLASYEEHNADNCPWRPEVKRLHSELDCFRKVLEAKSDLLSITSDNLVKLRAELEEERHAVKGIARIYHDSLIADIRMLKQDAERARAEEREACAKVARHSQDTCFCADSSTPCQGCLEAARI